MSVLQLVREDLRDMRAYQAAEQVANTIRLNANESPREGLQSNCQRPLNRYPEIRPLRLQQQLAERFAVSAKNLLVTRGSSEAIDLLIRTFCQAGRESVVIPTPSFSMYRHYAKIQGIEIIEVSSGEPDNFDVDVTQLVSAMTQHTKLIFLCTPNNPTGALTPLVELQKLLSTLQGSAAVVVDEAYIEFARSPSAIELLDANSNLIVLRTLSKALGLAGARCGAVVADAELISLLAAVQAPYSMATPVIDLVEAALVNPKADQELIDQTHDERERLTAALRGMNIVDRVWPSAANFVLVRFDNAATVMAHCKDANILLRDYCSELPDCIRITIGSKNENDQLLVALAELEGRV